MDMIKLTYNNYYKLHDTQGRPEILSHIKTESLSLYYRNNAAFKNVNLSIEPGSITAIVGPSGCGKTSFLLSLNRLTDLISGCRITGSMRIGDLDILDPKIDVTSLRLRVGMIFQKPNPLPLSIRKNIALPLMEHCLVDKNNVDFAVEKVLNDVGLWNEVKDRLNTSALCLSGGQQQRLCIARTLALEPQVVLLDEPCSALDPLSSALVEDLIMSLKGRYTIIVVTHNLAQARRVADYVALFWAQNGAGSLIEYGATEQIFDAPKQEITAAYISGMRG